MDPDGFRLIFPFYPTTIAQLKIVIEDALSKFAASCIAASYWRRKIECNREIRKKRRDRASTDVYCCAYGGAYGVQEALLLPGLLPHERVRSVFWSLPLSFAAAASPASFAQELHCKYKCAKESGREPGPG